MVRAVVFAPVAAFALVALPAPAARLAPVPKGPPAVVKNSIGMEMRHIPAGGFLMGSPDTDKDAQPDEKPQHKVRITQAFRIGVTTVTIGQYREFVKATGYKTDAEQNGGAWKTITPGGKLVPGKAEHNWQNPGFEVTDRHPVVNVNYPDAEEFCKWLSKVERKTYRLPTEAEWEYACRAGTTTRWSCGDDKDELLKVANIVYDTFPKFARMNSPKSGDRGFLFVAPVAEFDPNPWGLYDVHGNVWQWCSDWYGEKYYAASPEADPKGPKDGDLRVIRGGTWSRGPLDCRSANRFALSGATSLWVGFRVVCEWSE